MKPGPTSIWRNRDLGLLVSGSTVNSIGDWLLELALPLYVFTETRSGIQTAAVYLVGLGVNFLFAPLGGRLADTWRLKTTLVTTNLLQILALGPLLFVDSDHVWPVFLVVVLQGLIRAVNDPASFALVPRLVAGDQLVAANSALSGGNAISRLVGAAAGGFAIEFGGMATVVAADGATFLIGALAAAFLSSRADEVAGAKEAEADADSSVRAGIRAVRRLTGLTAIVWIQALAAFVFGGFPVLFIVFITDYLQGSASDVGLVRSTSAFGGLLGAATVGALSSRVTPARLMTGGYLAFGLVSSLFVNAPTFTIALWVYVVLYGSTGFPNMASGVGTQSTIQLLTPQNMMGRVAGLMTAVTSLTMGLGSVFAGIGLEFTTARTLLNVQCAIFLVCGVIGAFFVVGRAHTPAA